MDSDQEICFINVIEVEKCYINLDYDKSRSNKYKSSITALTKNANFVGDVLESRILGTITMINNNLHNFQSVCNHPDVPVAIKEFLYCCPKTLRKTKNFTSENVKQEIWTLMLTLLNFCPKQEIQLFLETCLIKKSSADNQIYKEYKNVLSHQTIDMILLEDADLYTVIDYLNTSENYRYLNKIWVLESILYKFLWLQDKWLQNFKKRFLNIDTFKSKRNLLTPSIYYKINVTSIWSEDLTAARDLAESLDRNIVLINTLDFYDSMVTMPYVEIFKVSLHEHLKLDEAQHIINTIKPTDPIKKIHNKKSNQNLIFSLLFYDGTWQTPVKNNYWTNKHTNTRVANATSDDISRCVTSAKKGFQIWRMWSIKFRMQALFKFAEVLKHNGKGYLAETVDKWARFPYWYSNSRIPQYPQTSITLVRSHRPKGVITLMESDETYLLRKMTQSLIIGNSVIVIYTAQTFSYNPAQYYSMLSTSGIPPGVVNLLSFEDAKLLSESYNAFELNDMYNQFTMTKQIATVLP